MSTVSDGTDMSVCFILYASILNIFVWTLMLNCFLLSFQQVARNQAKSFEDHPPRNKGTFVSERVSRYEAEQKLKAIQSKQEQVQKRRLGIVQKREELLKRSACVSTFLFFFSREGSALSVMLKQFCFC